MGPVAFASILAASATLALLSAEYLARTRQRSPAGPGLVFLAILPLWAVVLLQLL